MALLNCVFDSEKSCAGFETCNVKGCISYIKGSKNIAIFGRNPGGLVVSVKNIVGKKVIEILTNTMGHCSYIQSSLLQDCRSGLMF